MPQIDTSIDHDTINKMQRQVEALEKLEGLLMRRRELAQSIIHMNAEWASLMPKALDFDTPPPRFIQRERKYG